jgi:hypothetical protein
MKILIKELSGISLGSIKRCLVCLNYTVNFSAKTRR